MSNRCRRNEGKGENNPPEKYPL